MSEYTELFKKALKQDINNNLTNVGDNLISALRELDSIKDKNRFPARFELMRFVEKHSIADNKDGTYTVLDANGKSYTFKKADSIPSIAELDHAALEQYLNWLITEAMNNDQDIMPENKRFKKRYYQRVLEALLFRNSWMRYRAQDQHYIERKFDRTCAYELGHILQFSYDEMQGFIERTLKDEIMITRNARDLVEAYCFKHGKPYRTAQELLTTYQQIAAMKDPAPYLMDENTQTLNDNVLKLPDNDDEFIAWLVKRNEILNRLSMSAYTVYSNLLMCAYLMLTPAKDNRYMVSELWNRCIENKENMVDYFHHRHDLFSLPPFDKLNWENVAAQFNEVAEWASFENRRRFYPRDFLQYLTIDENGEWKVESTFQRIPSLMKREEEITKKDILCPLWFIYMYTWGSEDFSDDVGSDLENRINAFIDQASGFLEDAHFMFYLPSLLEFSIVRSLLIYEDTEDVYKTLINQGGNYAPLVKDVYFILHDHTEYAVRFYGCDFTNTYLLDVLYNCSQGENELDYNDNRKRIEHIISATAETMECGWEWIDVTPKPEHYCQVEIDEKGIMTSHRV